MPQGKLRSGVYRSFIMCDDPRGVVECGAIKKQSKSRGKGKEKSEMAKGIQKLNVAIESWSKGLSYEAVRPVDIAKDLLRGALDLEESLAMLTSIQEDDIKHKQRITNADLRFQRSMSDRFGERTIDKRMMIQEDAASRDCYEELRQVIRESFVRQNLVPRTTSRGPNTRLLTSHFASTSGTSSSQSSLLSASTKSSASSDIIPQRAPSLIARLMGLDASPQEPPKSTVNDIDKLDILRKSSESKEQLKKNKKKKKEHPEIPRCNYTREAAEIPSTIRPQRVVQLEMEQNSGSKRPVMLRKPRMQGEVHPRMINQRKDPSSNKMNLPSSLAKKDREPKGTVRKVEGNEGKVIILMSPSNAKAVKKDGKPMETNKKLSVKREDGEGKDRYRPHDRALNPKSNNSSDISRNKSRPSRLSTSSSSSEQKGSIREKKTSRPNGKKKLRQQENDLASENNSGSSQDTHRSLNQLSQEETTSSEFHTQGHCDNGEVSSCAATVEHSHETETYQISLKSFLSCSPDFHSYAEDLFDLNTNKKRSQESAFQNRDSIVSSDKRIALDFAKEVANRRSLLLVAGPTCPQRSSVSIDELLMEVCDGFESLRSYRDTFLGENSFVKESIQMVLEKDLQIKKTEMTSGIWDLGWRSEFQIDETHQAVVDLEKLILSGLIHEILS